MMLDSDHIHTKAYLRKTVSIVLPTILDNSTLAEDINLINGLYFQKWAKTGQKASWGKRPCRFSTKIK